MSKPLKNLLSYYTLHDKQPKTSTPSTSTLATEQPPLKVDHKDNDAKDKNRLRLKTSIETVRFLALQSIFNHDNFFELIKLSSRYHDKIAQVFFENDPQSAKYTSPTILKEILRILGDIVRRKIRQEVGDSKFCILVDETQDASDKLQVSIVLRFVDEKGFIKERFFGMVGVADIAVSTLKKEISDVLAYHDLQIGNLRGQGYDGSSDAREAWNGLQALFNNECPFTYYVHCFEHQLQLSLDTASKEVLQIWSFFSKLDIIVSLFTTFLGCQSKLTAQEILIAEKVTGGGLESGRGSNQTKTLQRECAIQWSSHFGSITILIDLFDPCLDILENLYENGKTNSIRAKANGVYVAMQTFEFVFILHLLHEMMSITHLLCQVLQRKTPDIVNALSLVTSTKTLLQRLRDDGWQSFFDVVESFCKEHEIDVPEMDDLYKAGTGRYCQQHDNITFKDHYQVDIFNAAIDFQLMELNHRFSESTMELLILGSTLDPRDSFKSFNVDKICELAKKFYPADFQNDVRALRSQLLRYETDVIRHPRFQNLFTLSDLCVVLAETRRGDVYYLVDRLIRLLLTLPVYTATTERAFSAMKLVKTKLHDKIEDEFLENCRTFNFESNKIEDEFLVDCMILIIERELAMDVDIESVVDGFDSLTDGKLQLI